MSRNPSVVILVLLVVAALSFLSGPVSGDEKDRGTVKKPDYVATPHPEESRAPSVDDVLSQSPNRSLADDLDGNGVVSRLEWKGKPADFTRLDANVDGVLSERELDSYVQIGVDRFAEQDADRNGVLTRSEWRDRMHFFRKLDRDKDGILTRNEFYFGP
ncbi:MAG TPA: hypothetical protein VLJ37_09760 [bacterium]|nr:hypothetical protein [bacterium]